MLIQLKSDRLTICSSINVLNYLFTDFIVRSVLVRIEVCIQMFENHETSTSHT